MLSSHAVAVESPAADLLKCRICGCKLGEEPDDDTEAVLCCSCLKRPEARRLGVRLVPPAASKTVAASSRKSARDFTDAERSLIGKVHGYMPAMQLLGLLNERLVCDLGPDVVLYTMEQLHAEIGKLGSSPKGTSTGWSAMRQLVAQARRSGALAAVNEQVIRDFAVVFSLNPKQVIHLRDILLSAKEQA